MGLFAARSAWVSLTVVGLLASLPGNASDTLINGAGATFPAPLYSKWISEFEKKNPEIKINYQPIGSGGGIRQFTEKTVDFAGSDAPMTEEQLQKAPSAIHIPTVLGAVVVTYNLPEVKTNLKLSPSLIAEIFLGKITQWNDPKIQTLNPGAKLGTLPILVVHRTDGSGTTNIFTDYLAKVSPEFKDQVGVGAAVQWPVGLGGKGNDGVSGTLKQTPGAIGYVELIYASNNGLPTAEIQNHAGKFVLPSTQSVTAAAESFLKKIPDDFRISITDAEGAGSYPISSFTYLLIPNTMPATKGKSVIKFLKWAVHDGQAFAEPLTYAKLPKSLVVKVDDKIRSLKTAE
jgi:phosphate transport system substrate-binding protein